MANPIDAGGSGGTYARGVVAQAQAAILPQVRRLIDESIGRIAVRAGGNLTAIGIRSALMFDPAATAVVDDPDHEQVIVPLAGAHTCCCCLPHLRTLPGLVSLWTFDDANPASARDEGPGANHAPHTVATSPDEAADAAAVTCDGRSYQFGAANAYFVAPDSASLSLTGPLTLLAWANYPYPDVEEGILSKGHAYGLLKTGGSGLGGIPSSANRLAMIIEKNSTSTTVIAVGTTPLAINTDYFLAGVYDGTNLLLYVNGVLESTTACAIAPENTTDTLSLGREQSGGSTTYARLDNLAVLNRALSAGEIETLFNACTRG
jgi:hypothetical protein